MSHEWQKSIIEISKVLLLSGNFIIYEETKANNNNQDYKHEYI